MSEDNVNFDHRETVQTQEAEIGAPQDDEDGNDISGIAQDDDDVTDADPDDDDDEDDDDDDDDEDALTDLGDETGAHV